MVHDLIDHASYMAHGYCLLWKPWLVAMHAGSDLVIFASYFAIPVAIWLFLRRRNEMELRPLAILFALFIFLCGLTHLVQMVTLWYPIYETQGFVKLATAAVSLATAILIFPLIPKALAIPSPRAMNEANEGLRREIAAHKETLLRLEEIRAKLEQNVRQRTEQLEHATRRLEALVTASAQVFWSAAPDGSVIQDSPSWRTFTGQTYDEWVGTGWLNAIHPDDRERTLSAWRTAIENRTEYNVDYRLQNVDGGYSWTTARGVPLHDDDGNVTEWVGMNEDISPRKRSEEHAHLIMRELSHRTKNLLAVISSLARRTFSRQGDAISQGEDFIDRIHGLSRSHDLLVRSDWRGVSLKDLVQSHLEPFGFDEDRITVSGPFVDLRPEAAQSIGLALHELATNTAKHGALKSASGRLDVSWRIDVASDSPMLRLTWEEETLDVPEERNSSGFGRLMLGELVGAALLGRTDYQIGGNRVVWTLTAPLDHLRVETGTAEGASAAGA
jgi:PAS domain S-box-containing protein